MIIRERSPRNPVLVAIAAATLLFFLAGPVTAAEEIRSYDSNIKLETNGTVDVTETITVNSEGLEIRHGIYRDIPTQLINDDKTRLRSDLSIKSVSRDGQPEPYSIEDIGGGYKRIKMGSADVWIDDGVHTYVIEYTMSRMGRFFADHDELYWNATGNFWVFPILKATAEITLPDGAAISGAVGYTGRLGSKEQAVTVDANGGKTASFAATRPLAPEEGMTVAVKFQKGILVEPSGLTKLGYWVSDHRGLVFPALAALLVLAYNLWAWNAVGRDPRKGTIIPLFHPPEGLDPAQVHYVSGMGFKQNGWTALTASIFDLGVKGLVTIDKAGKATTINVTNATPAAALPVGEGSLYNFFKSKGSVTIDKTDGPSLNGKRGELVTEIKSNSGETYFKNNVSYTLIGVALSIIALIALVALDVLNPGMLVVAAVVAIVLGVIIGVFSGGGNIIGKLIPIIWIGIVGFNVFGSALSFASGINFDLGFVGAASIIVIEIVFAFLMRAPTVAGRKLMDQIEGFKMYLQTAEANRLNYQDKGEPQMTIKRFEAILPFAIALGVEKLWSQRFEADLARNAVADATGGTYSPLWYTGSNWSSSSEGFSNAVSSVASGMSAAMIASQPSSSSSSGFSGGGGGGGSSGGGGGGGGGGGW
jgi:uncharacterized membrane protein YgcG